MSIYILVSGILGVWLFIVSLVLFWQIKFFRNLTRGSKTEDLQKVLERILQTQDSNSKNVDSLDKNLKKLADAVSYHVQKVGLVKFNPFHDMGGDHSFSLALLDGKDTGFILTTLHTRDRTRIYVKVVKNGKSDLAFSDEEKKALKEAIKK